MSYHTFDIEVDGEHSSENLKRKQTKIKYLATTAILLLATLVCTVWIQTGTTSVPREGVAVTGVITYMSLDINRKAALFEDYKKRFQKKVGLEISWDSVYVTLFPTLFSV